MRVYLTGDAEIERALRYLQDKAADRVAKSAIGAGLNVLRRAIHKAAPRGATLETSRSIGRRLERSKRTGAVTAKVGVGVGKLKKGQARTKAAHAHIVAIRMHFVRTAYQTARGSATVAMKKRAELRLAREAAKARNGA